MTTYKDAGVDVDLGNDASKILYEASKLTWKNRKGRLDEVTVPLDDFSGTRYIHVSGMPQGTVMCMNSDGNGTKIEVFEKTRNHRTAAYDLFAMVCDDAVAKGAEPVLLTSVLDVNSLGKDGETRLAEVRQLAEGYIHAAKEANVAVVNGEIAELGNRVGGYGQFNYNWSATVTWFGRKKIIEEVGKEIKEGDVLVGLQEYGFRSNGLSLVRKILQDHYGDDWHIIPWKKRKMGQPLEDPYRSHDWRTDDSFGTFGEWVLMPSKIYTRAVVDMFGGYDGEPKAEVHGAAHITGGGIPEKLGRVLNPLGLGAIIDNPFSPPGFMEYVQALGNVSYREAYKTWNMGQGMIIITPDPSKVQKVATEHGIDSQIIGAVAKEPGIKIKNKGAFSEKGEKYLTF